MRQWASQASDCEKLKNMMLIKLAPVYVNEWGGPPTASYRWTGWVLRNNRFKSKTSGRLQIGLGNFTEYSLRNWKMSTCKRETLGSRPIMPKIFLTLVYVVTSSLDSIEGDWNENLTKYGNLHERRFAYQRLKFCGSAIMSVSKFQPFLVQWHQPSEMSVDNTKAYTLTTIYISLTFWVEGLFTRSGYSTLQIMQSGLQQNHVPRTNAVLQQSLQCHIVNLFLSIDVNFKCGKYEMYMWTTMYIIAGVLT